MQDAAPVFRVFVSSTFADMQAERRLLQREVFPRVEQYCRERGVSFQAVDLRWGIPEEFQLRHQTMEMCLEEIAQCQRVSPKPNFLVLVGDRYGWQPAPATIPAADWTALLPHVDRGGRGILERWYHQDDNAIPPELVLQPRGPEHRDYLDWEPVESALLNVLRRAVTAAGIAGPRASRYFTSATHQETLRGILAPPSDLAEDPANHAFAYVRQSRHKGGLGEPSEFGRGRLDELRRELKKRLGPAGHYHEYAASWQGNQAKFDSEAVLADRIYRDLTNTIGSRLGRAAPVDPQAQQHAIHRRHRDTLCSKAILRPKVLADLQRELDAGGPRPVHLVGPPGSGKSTLLAQLAASIEAAKGHVYYRFVGLTAQSSALGPLIRSLSAELSPSGTADSGPGAEPRLDQLLALASARAVPDKPVLLLIDGVDELATTEERESGWLPAELPDGVRLVVSHATGSGPAHVQVPKFARTEGEAALDHWFAQITRRLTQPQTNRILDGFAPHGSPLHLHLAFLRARAARSYDEPVTLAPDLESAVEQFFTDLERENGPILVGRTVAYLLSGRYRGLTEAELLDLLPNDHAVWKEFLESCHPDTREEVRVTRKLPAFTWARVHRALQPYLAERDCYGTTLLTLFHSQLLGPVVERRYLAAPAGHGSTTVGEHCHQRLAEYWGKMPNGFDGPPTAHNRRKLVEWPWQLVEAHDRWPAAIAAFGDSSFLMACRESGLWWEVYAALLHALTAARQLGFYQEANRFSDLVSHLNAFENLHRGRGGSGSAALDLLPAGQAWETLEETRKLGEEIWFKRDPVALGLANLGAEHLRMGEIEQGLKLLNEAITRDPDCELAHYNLGAYASNTESWAQAEQHYREVVRINPENRNAREALAQIERYRAAALPSAGGQSPKDYVREAMRVVNLRGDVSRGQQLLQEGLTRFPGDASLQRALDSLRRTFGAGPDPSPQQGPPPLRVTFGPPSPPAPPVRPPVPPVDPIAPAARKGRPASDPRSKRVGRNDPCPCGSGKKYSRCHGAR